MTLWNLIRPDNPEAHLARCPHRFSSEATRSRDLLAVEREGLDVQHCTLGQSAEDCRRRALALVLVHVDLERERPRMQLRELELGFDRRDEIDTLVHKLMRLEALKDRRDLARERADRVYDRDDVEKAVGRVAVGEGSAPVATNRTRQRDMRGERRSGRVRTQDP